MREENNFLATSELAVFYLKSERNEYRLKNYILGILFISLLLLSNIFGQSAGNENSTDRTLRGAGRVNASSLGMEFSLPLGNYPGRGINVPVSLSYSSKVWRAQFDGSYQWIGPGGNNNYCIPATQMKFAENTASGWTSSITAPYIEYTGVNTVFNHEGFPLSFIDVDCPMSGGGGDFYPNKYIKRLVIHLPGGGSHEFRADDMIYLFAPGNSDPNSPYNAANWNTTFYAVDGSNLKYVQDSATGTYRLWMPDGSFYDFNASTTHGADRKATKFTDRNGNYTTYYSPGSVDENNITHPNGYWKDTLGRNISIPLGLSAPSSPTTAQNPQVYSLPGMTGFYKLQWKHLKGSSAAESGLMNYSDNLRYIGNRHLYWGGARTQETVNPSETYLFSDGGEYNSLIRGGQELFNPIVLTEIELPNGHTYEFKYDIYGRIVRIIYPTGGKELFQYAIIPTLTVLEYGDVSGQANHGVVNRKLYENSEDETPYEWTYNAVHVNPHGYKVTINNPDGTKGERFLHRGNDRGISLVGSYGYDNILAGMPYEERAFDNEGNLVTRKLTHWTQSLFGDGGWHPRVDHEESYIYDSSGNGVYGTIKYEYENEANLTRESPVLLKKTLQYAFVATSGGSSIAPDATPNPNPTPISTPTPPTLLRTTDVTFLINDTSVNNRQDYKDRNMVGLTTASVLKDGAGEIVSRIEMKYDESGYSPQDFVRGNPTTSRVWDSTKGAVTNTNAYIATRAKFDAWGNQIESTDAKGNTTVKEYDATYHAYPIKVTTPIPDPTGQKGSNTAFETTTTYNSITGLPLTTTDANGQTTTMEYDPVTLRPTRLIPPAGAAVTETIYHDERNNYWVKNRKQIDANNWAESITYFDGLGRAYKTEEINSQGSIFVNKEFDSDGRVLRVSNPYRLNNDPCYQNNQIVCWTTNVYDEASRIKEVILQDGAKIKTNYGVSVTGVIGVTKQIADQAGKKRKGITDALGRMIRVIEDPDGQNLSTDYVFDTLGNLRKTTQGEQNRYFMHDSLRRLRYAKQPEEEPNQAFVVTDAITNNSQWSVKYEYDDNGNIVSTADARGVTILAVYDNLNRLIFRDYSDLTPDVDFYYDGRGLSSIPAYSKGKTTRVSSIVSDTRYTSFSNLGQLLTHQQITDGQTYNTSYQYDAFGALISETYPSGRTVKFDFNQDGDVASIWGTVGANNRLYANAINYNSSGAIERMRLGNGKWETAKYNNRLQITEIGFGNSADDKSLLKLEYSYGNNTQNNGSLRSQKINFNGLAQPFEQVYTYDDLNRLLSATETVNSQITWKQTFQYDRYGNRRFDANNTTTLTASNNISNPEIGTVDNRFSSGQNYLYDKTGNLTQDALGNQFLYDAENHQKEVKNSSNETVGLYFYDGEGRRVKKISNTETTVFVYDGSGQLVAEYSTNVVPQAAAKISYLTTDHLGSPRVITDSTGQIIARKDFGAFGDETFTAQRTESLGYKPENIRQDYTGYQKDDETGLEYAKARYYNPSHGRFTSVDPLTASATTKDPQTFNRYTYALNSPYKFIDPLGLISQNADASGGCNFECRILMAAASGVPLEKSDLSEDDKFLLQAHIAAGTALGYSFINAVQGQSENNLSNGDEVTFTVLNSGTNQVPDGPNREQVSDFGTLGPKTTGTGGYFLFNLQADFSEEANVSDYKHVRTAIIIQSPDSSQNGVRSGGDENPDGSQTRVSGQTRFVSDTPGVSVSGVPRATLKGSVYTVIFIAGEYNKKTKSFASGTAFYGLQITFDNKGGVDTSKTIVQKISREEFIKLGGDYIPKQKQGKQKNPCPECLLKP